MNISKIFREKKIESNNLITPAWTYKLHLESDERLTEMLTNVGSKRLRKITKRVTRIQETRFKKQQAYKKKIAPYLEQRDKIHTAIQQTIVKIRELPEESVTTQGISEVKTLYGLLDEMEKCESQLNALGVNCTYSYKTSDLPLNDLNATLYFLSKIRSGKIFRSQPRKRR